MEKAYLHMKGSRGVSTFGLQCEYEEILERLKRYGAENPLNIYLQLCKVCGIFPEVCQYFCDVRCSESLCLGQNQ